MEIPARAGGRRRGAVGTMTLHPPPRRPACLPACLPGTGPRRPPSGTPRAAWTAGPGSGTHRVGARGGGGLRRCEPTRESGAAGKAQAWWRQRPAWRWLCSQPHPKPAVAWLLCPGPPFCVSYVLEPTPGRLACPRPLVGLRAFLKRPSVLVLAPSRSTEPS